MIYLQFEAEQRLAWNRSMARGYRELSPTARRYVDRQMVHNTGLIGEYEKDLQFMLRNRRLSDEFPEVVVA